MTPQFFSESVLLWFYSKANIGRFPNPNSQFCKCVRSIVDQLQGLSSPSQTHEQSLSKRLFLVSDIFWFSEKMTLPLQECYLLHSLIFSFIMWSYFWKASGMYRDSIYFFFFVNNDLIIFIKKHKFSMENSNNSKKIYKEDIKMTPKSYHHKITRISFWWASLQILSVH